MIFISVGTANKGFDSLIKLCDNIAMRHSIDFFAQIGSTMYEPKHMPFEKWLTAKEIQSRYHSANGYIIHGGFGTISEVLPFNKPIIVVPRSMESGEAVNDQRDLSLKLDSLGYVKCVTDLSLLEDIILNINSIKLNRYSGVSDIPNILSCQINLFRKTTS